MDEDQELLPILHELDELLVKERDKLISESLKIIAFTHIQYEGHENLKNFLIKLSNDNRIKLAKYATEKLENRDK